mgnify:CR=1 FL=1
MANFKEIKFNDGKEKSQSYEYRIELTENAPWYYNNFYSVTGFGENEEEAKRECLTYLKVLLNDLMNFIEEIDEKEYR